MRKLFAWLPKSRGKRILMIAALVLGTGLLLLVVLGITAFFLFRSPKFQQWAWPVMIRRQATGELAPPPEAPPGPPYRNAVLDAAAARSAADVFQNTNVWNVHLKFTAEQWKALGPNQIRGVPNWIQENGQPILRNPKASRAGLAGVLGLDFPWSSGDAEFGGLRFTNVAARFKGNGTFLGALQNYKRPFKIELDKHATNQVLAGRTTLNFGNLSADFSCLADALGYEFFRDAGVPAPRTAFARLFLTVGGKFEERLIGLYVMVENPDAEWADEFFRSKRFAVFKPVTHELFADLGKEWKAYEPIYDPKTPTTPDQQRRVIELAQLVTHATDGEFSARIGEFLELGECARYFACEVLLANYDGIFTNGQNFLLYLNPVTGQFGIIPWDLDHSWGEFFLIATAEQRERSSISHPWVGENRFLERLFATEDFKRRYREEIERILAALFAPERLSKRLDALAAVVRPAIAEESPDRLAKFEIAVAEAWQDGPRDSNNPFDPNRPVHQLKRFIEARAKNVREQLDGKAEGIVLSRRKM